MEDRVINAAGGFIRDRKLQQRFGGPQRVVGVAQLRLDVTPDVGGHRTIPSRSMSAPIPPPRFSVSSLFVATTNGENARPEESSISAASRNASLHSEGERSSTTAAMSR